MKPADTATRKTPEDVPGQHSPGLPMGAIPVDGKPVAWKRLTGETLIRETRINSKPRTLHDFPNKAGDRIMSHNSTEIGLNVFAMPSDVAYEFISFCFLNYSSGSIVDITEPGSPLLFEQTAVPVDVRTGAASYDLMSGSKATRHVTSLDEAWTSNTVAVAVGCSVAVDTLLLDAGIYLKHVARDTGLAVYATRHPTRRVGRFGPRQHVSMRIVKKDDVDRVAAITALYPALHGGPVHVGDPRVLGIDDLSKPLLGGGLVNEPDETCLFWGCGVTLRKALEAQHGLAWMANSEGRLLSSRRSFDSFRR